MWEISNTTQITSFLYSLIFGIIFGIIYDIFRSLRIVKYHTAILVFIEDTLYFAILSFFTFIFFLALTNGEIRAYILIGIILGFLLFFFTFSKHFIIVLSYIFKGIKFVFSNIKKAFYYIFDKIDSILVNFLKNTLKCFKKGLKKVGNMLYTNKN